MANKVHAFHPSYYGIYFYLFIGVFTAFGRGMSLPPPPGVDEATKRRWEMMYYYCSTVSVFTNKKNVVVVLPDDNYLYLRPTTATIY